MGQPTPTPINPEKEEQRKKLALLGVRQRGASALNLTGGTTGDASVRNQTILGG